MDKNVPIFFSKRHLRNMLSDRGKENDLRKVRINYIIQVIKFSSDEKRRICFLYSSKDTKPMTTYWNYSKSWLTHTAQKTKEGFALLLQDDLTRFHASLFGNPAVFFFTKAIPNHMQRDLFRY